MLGVDTEKNARGQTMKDLGFHGKNLDIII